MVHSDQLNVDPTLEAKARLHWWSRSNSTNKSLATHTTLNKQQFLILRIYFKIFYWEKKIPTKCYAVILRRNSSFSKVVSVSGQQQQWQQ